MKQGQRYRGFSLLETIYATLLLGFIALFLLNLYPSSFVAIKRGESTFTADNFAETILEDLHSRNFANLIPGSEPSYLAQSWGGITYTPTLQLLYLPTPTDAWLGNPNYIKVAQVTISWTYSTLNHQVVHEAYLHNITQ